MTRAMYPGSFDPVHLGHVDVVEAVAGVFDEIVVVAMTNPAKEGMFTDQERQDMLDEALAHLPNVSTARATGLAIDVAARLDAPVIVKGVRGGADLEIELQMAQTNKAVSGVQTLFVPTEPVHSFVSSRFVREIAVQGGDVSPLVPEGVARRLREMARSSSQERAEAEQNAPEGAR